MDRHTMSQNADILGQTIFWIWKILCIIDIKHFWFSFSLFANVVGQ